MFSKNRDRLIEQDPVRELFSATVQMAEQRGLLSDEHFSVDGMLIQAWASHKSMRRKDGSDDGRPRSKRVECRELIDLPEQRREITERVPQTDRRTRFLYFPYWSATIDSRRSAQEQAAIVADLDGGFAVASVRGFASPEGSRAAHGRFEGNEALSGARAEAALDWLRATCGERGAACLPPDLLGEAGNERHTLLEAAPDGSEAAVEVEGPRQADFASDAFASDPGDAAQRTPEVTDALARARTPAQRAAVVYPQLRRAEIELTRTRDVERQRTEVTPAHTEERDVIGGCPQRIREAAFPTRGGS